MIFSVIKHLSDFFYKFLKLIFKLNEILPFTKFYSFYNSVPTFCDKVFFQEFFFSIKIDILNNVKIFKVFTDLFIPKIMH